MEFWALGVSLAQLWRLLPFGKLTALNSISREIWNLDICISHLSILFWITLSFTCFWRLLIGLIIIDLQNCLPISQQPTQFGACLYPLIKCQHLPAFLQMIRLAVIMKPVTAGKVTKFFGIFFQKVFNVWFSCGDQPSLFFMYGIIFSKKFPAPLNL